MAIDAEQLATLGRRFIESLNDRDFDTASSLYADDAVYESAGRLGSEHADGRIRGRDEIIGFFRQALDGDDEFRLEPQELFTGLDIVVIRSGFEGRSFVDVLRFNGAGQIAEHFDVTPQ